MPTASRLVSKTTPNFQQPFFSTQPENGSAASILTVRCVLKLAVIFLLIFAAHLYLIHHFSTPTPFWDQWDGEGLALLKPWIEKQRSWELFFIPHNEHRIVPTKLLSIVLFVINGQWDAQVAMVTAALIYSLALAALAYILIRQLGNPFQNAVLLVIATYGCLPYAWENITWGFQSQFYFLIGFSIGAIWGLCFHKSFSTMWILGACSLVLAIFSMGAGAIAPMAIGILEILRCTKTRTWKSVQSRIPTLIVAAIVLTLAIKLRVHTPPDQIVPNIQVFVTAFLQSLAWPFTAFPFSSIIIYFPIAALTIGYLFSLRPFNSANKSCIEFLFSISLFVVLLAAAMAYARGGLYTIPPSRYGDILALGVLANLFALLLICDLPNLSSRTRAFTTCISAVWICLLILGLTQNTKIAFHIILPYRMENLLKGDTAAKQYLANQNTFSQFDQFKRLFPDSSLLRNCLDEPHIRNILPHNIHLPLAVCPIINKQNKGFILNGGYYPTTPAPETTFCWGSYGSEGNETTGRFMAIVDKVHTPYLKIPLAGYLGKPGLSLTLTDQASGKTFTVSPSEPAGEKWVDVFVKAPGKHLILTAVDQSPNCWFAFASPVECGVLSYWTAILLQHWYYLSSAGFMLLALSFFSRPSAQLAPLSLSQESQTHRLTPPQKG